MLCFRNFLVSAWNSHVRLNKTRYRLWSSWLCTTPPTISLLFPLQQAKLLSSPVCCHTSSISAPPLGDRPSFASIQLVTTGLYFKVYFSGKQTDDSEERSLFLSTELAFVACRILACSYCNAFRIKGKFLAYHWNYNYHWSRKRCT
jgi:hypothetical protein